MLGSVLLLVIGAVAVAVITTPGDDSPTVVESSSPAPAPAPEPVETNDPLLDILEETWNEQSSSDQEQLCWLFNVAPDEAWDSFNSGSEGLLPKDTFDEFFEEQC